MPRVGRPPSPSSGGEVNAWAQKHLHTLRATPGICRHVQVFCPGRSVSLLLMWARTVGLREGCNWQAGGISEERLQLGSACGLPASPAHGEQREFHQVIHTWKVPWKTSCGSAWLSLFTASPKFLRSRGRWSRTIPPSQEHSCLQPSPRPLSLPSSEVSLLFPMPCAVSHLPS